MLVDINIIISLYKISLHKTYYTHSNTKLKRLEKRTSIIVFLAFCYIILNSIIKTADRFTGMHHSPPCPYADGRSQSNHKTNGHNHIGE